MKFKRILPVLAMTGVMILPLNVFAAQDQESTPADSDQAKIQLMVDSGLSQPAAEHIRKVGSILEKLQQNGQVIDLSNNELIIENPKDKSEQLTGISKEDEDFIKKTFKEELTKTHISRDKKVSDLQDNIKKFPGRSKYKIDFSDGSTIEATATLERTDEIQYNKVSVNGNYHYPNETEIGSGVSYSDGTYNHTYTMSETDNDKYWDWLSIGVNYTVSNGQHHVHINDYGPDQKADGIVHISNSASAISVADTDYNVDPLTWCSTYNQITFNFTGSLGITLAGVFNISINAGTYWTQTAITRESLVSQHDYAAHG